MYTRYLIEATLYGKSISKPLGTVKRIVKRQELMRFSLRSMGMYRSYQLIDVMLEFLFPKIRFFPREKRQQIKQIQFYISKLSYAGDTWVTNEYFQGD